MCEATERMVPVKEAIRYRKRAIEAEARVEVLESKLAETRLIITYLERRQKVDALLAEADAIDLETARLLVNSAIENMETPDVELAVEDLRRHKPYLFRNKNTVQEAAEQTTKTGDRKDLLRYLRLRRPR